MRAEGIRTALYVSGGGSTAEAAIKSCQENKLIGIDPVAVISNRKSAGAVAKAEALGIQTFIVPRSQYETSEAYGDELLKIMKNLGVDLISQNGWLVNTPSNVASAYEGWIINQHPGPNDPGRSNDPEVDVDFGGRGMHGSRVTCARIAYELLTKSENPWTESTTHFVTSSENLDDGDLIRISKIHFEIPGELRNFATIADIYQRPDSLINTTLELQSKLLPVEHDNVIATLQLFAKNEEVKGFRRKEPLVPTTNRELLSQVKKLAINLFPNG